MKKRIVLFSGGRSDFGLLKNIILKFQKSKKFNTDVFVGPSHFSKNFGYTFNEVKISKIKNIKKIRLKNVHTDNINIAALISKIIKDVTRSFYKKKYDLAIVLGDRYEVFAFSFVCTLFKIPIAHIHGGEVTLGAYDNQFRNAITKMACLHFTSTKKHQLNVIKMGENRRLVKNVGAPAIENIKLKKFKAKVEIFKKYKIPLNQKVVMINMHPETMSKISVSNQISSLIESILMKKKLFFIITSPSPDTGGVEMLSIIKRLTKNHSNIRLIESFGQDNYFNVMKYCSFVCGNSSSGIIEAASLGIKTLNVGERQKGRQLSNQTINVKNNLNEISKGMDMILKKKIKKIVNPYDGGKTTNKVFSIIKNIDLDKILVKKYDY